MENFSGWQSMCCIAWTGPLKKESRMAWRLQGAKIVPFEIKSINGMKLILRPWMKFFKKILAPFSAFARLATAGRNEANS